MPIDEMTQQTDSLSQLSGMPQGGMPQGGMPQGGAPGMGGPGVDTPQEKQAVEKLMQAAQLMRAAANDDPSIRPMIDKTLQDAFLQITEHYGFGEEGKLALKQAQIGQNRARASALEGAGPPTQGPPMQGPPAQNMAIQY